MATTIDHRLEIYQKYIQVNDRVLEFGARDHRLITLLKCQTRAMVPVDDAGKSPSNIAIYERIENVPKDSLDVVISHHALELTLNPADILKQIKEKLVRGGRLVISVPIDDWRNQNYVDPNPAEKHFYTWTPLLIGNILYEIGYEVEKAVVYLHDWIDDPKVSHLPQPIQDLHARYRAWRYKRRQLIAVAKNV